MPFDYPEEDQDERIIPPDSHEPGTGEPAYGANLPHGVLPMSTPARVLQPGARSAFWQMRPQPATRNLGINQVIAATGQEQASPLGGAFSLSEVGMRPPQRMGVGQRILGLNVEPAKGLKAALPRARTNAKPLDWRSRSGLPNARPLQSAFLPQKDALVSGYGSFFSSFVPAGAVPQGGHTTHSEPVQSPSVNGMSQGLGRAAGTRMGSAANGALATAARQSSTSGTSNTPVVDVSNLVRARSRIHQAKPVPEVKPNLALRPNKNDRDQFKKTLGTVMQGMDKPRVPRAVRHLTEDDKQRVAHEAYGETARGSVQEHEAIISTILNRVRSGDRQYVDHGQEFTVANVIGAHTRKGNHQFQAIDNDAYVAFSQANDQGSRNAQIAAENVAANGPTTHATAFIVTNGRLPRSDEVSHLGKVQFVQRIGNVFLYEPKPTPQPHGVVPHRRHHSGQGGPRR
jgi:spore germination cell wall hydrolase CwlJ-like protein